MCPWGVCVGGGACAHVETRVDHGRLSYSFDLHLLSETSSLTEPEAHDLAKIAGRCPRIPTSPSLVQGHAPCWASYASSKSLHIFRVAQQVPADRATSPTLQKAPFSKSYTLKYWSGVEQFVTMTGINTLYLSALKSAWKPAVFTNRVWCGWSSSCLQWVTIEVSKKNNRKWSL